MGVYIPPRAEAEAACDSIFNIITVLQTQHPEALILISGDFSHVTFYSTLASFYQYVFCPTRNNKTLDLLYANVKDAYKAIPLPPLCKFDHSLVLLQPTCTPVVKRKTVIVCQLIEWSAGAEEALKDCFATTHWNLLVGSHGNDIQRAVSCMADYLNFFRVDMVVPVRSFKCFANNKPWITREVKAVLNRKKASI